MAYTSDRGVFLEESFLLEAMPGIKGEYIKIYIFAKYLSEQNGGKTDLQTIGDALCLDTNEVKTAAHMLAQIGVIRLGAGGIVECCGKAKADALHTGERTSYMPGEVGAIIEADKELSDMLAIAQKMLGRLLSPHAIDKLYGFYDWLGMTPELILRLLEYCVELDKKDMRYIEKVAISWHEMGIVSVSDAEEYIKRQSYKRTYGYRVQKLLGIDNRRPTASESKYIEAWYTRAISEELISFAYDYAVSKTGKLAMAYINKVLVSWSESGIKTAAQAQESIQRFGEAHSSTKRAAAAGKANKDFDVYNSGRYNYDEIDALARRKLKERLGKE